MQNQIRQNATEVSSYLQDLAKWEKSIKAKDKKIISKKGSQPRAPVRAGVGTVSTTSILNNQTTPLAVVPGDKSGLAVQDKKATGVDESAASHTYDKGYKKWEKLDVDALLAEQDKEDDELAYGGAHVEPEEEDDKEGGTVPSSSALTPATMADRVAPHVTAQVSRSVPKARGMFADIDAETAERDLGNAQFKKGNFAAAVKSYTRCLGLRAKNYVAFSNRAMAYLKLKDFVKAEQDCSSALSIQPDHCKSLVRRASACTSQGKLRAAVQDLLAATATSDGATSKSVAMDLAKAREQLKNAISRAPMVLVDEAAIVWEEEGDAATMLEGPEAPGLSGIPEGASRVTIIDDVDEEERLEDVEQKPTAISIEFDDDEEAPDGDVRTPAPAAAPKMAIPSKKERDSAMLKGSDRLESSSEKEKKPKKSKKKSRAAAGETGSLSGRKSSVSSGKSLTGYELERLLLNCRTSKSAQKDLFTRRLTPSVFEAVLSTLLEADVLYDVFNTLNVYLAERTADGAKVFATYTTVLSRKPDTERAVQLLVRLLSRAQRQKLMDIVGAWIDVASGDDASTVESLEVLVNFLAC